MFLSVLLIRSNDIVPFRKFALERRLRTQYSCW